MSALLHDSRFEKRAVSPSDLFWLTETQMMRLEPYLPKCHGKPRVDDRRVLGGTIFVNRNGLRWRDAPSNFGPYKTLYNRWKRWRCVAERHRFERGHEQGIFARMMSVLAAEHGKEKTVMIPSHRNCVSTAGQWTRPA